MELQPGTTLGPYEIIALIGTGGMGEVYEARDPRLDRRIAIKVLDELGRSSNESRQRFHREARAVAALNHPNIITIHSVEEVNGLPFLTMELLSGQSLSVLIPEDGMPAQDVARIGGTLAAAVAAAHDQGIIHRDLKPANIMITSAGVIKVLDFGLAKFRSATLSAEATTQATSGLTEKGQFVGTVAYMSPEQAEGKPVDARSDIFSLGVILYELTTGERPFKGETTLSVMSSILKDSPRPLSQVKPFSPPQLERLINRCLQKEASRRYQTALDLHSDLLNVGDQLPSQENESDTKRLGRRALGSVVLVGALLALATAGWRWWSKSIHEPDRQLVSVGRMARLTTDGNASVAAISRDGRYVVHVNSTNGRESLWVRQLATTSDIEIVPAASVRYQSVNSHDGNHLFYVTYPRGTPQAGQWGTLYRVPSLGGRPQRILQDIDSGVAISPNGDRIAFVRFIVSAKGTESRLMIAESAGREERVLAAQQTLTSFGAIRPSWSPNGDAILVTTIQGAAFAVHIVDAISGKMAAVPGTWASLTAFDWMPDGESFMASGAPGLGEPSQVWRVWAVDGHRERLSADLNDYADISVSKDGTTLVAIQTEAIANIYVVSSAGEARPVTSGRVGDGVEGLTWTADGIVFGSTRSGEVELWKVQPDGSSLTPVSPGLHPVSAPSSTADARYVFCHRNAGDGWRIWRAELDGGDARAITPGPVDLYPVVSDDDQWLYYTSITASGPVAFKIPIKGGEPAKVGVNFAVNDLLPDGRLLGGLMKLDATNGPSEITVALMNPDGSIAERLTDIPFMFGPSEPVRWPSATPDGTRITFIDVREDGGNVWSRPITGGSRSQLTHFRGDWVFGFAWSPDGRLAVAKGQRVRDVVTMSLSGGRSTQ